MGRSLLMGLLLAFAATLLSAQTSAPPTAPKAKYCSIDKQAKQLLLAEYPESLKGSGIMGVVGLRLVVDEDGCPHGVTVVKKLHPLLDKIAKKAVETWKFQPAMKGGKPVRVLILLEVEFKETQARDQSPGAQTSRKVLEGEVVSFIVVARAGCALQPAA